MSLVMVSISPGTDAATLESSEEILISAVNVSHVAKLVAPTLVIAASVTAQEMSIELPSNISAVPDRAVSLMTEPFAVAIAEPMVLKS